MFLNINENQKKIILKSNKNIKNAFKIEKIIYKSKKYLYNAIYYGLENLFAVNHEKIAKSYFIQFLVQYQLM